MYAPAYPATATESAAGLVKMAANQADSTAEDTAALVTDFNALLAKLKAAGLMTADEE
nr:head fiber protein [Syntrophomonas zehnderi]